MNRTRLKQIFINDITYLHIRTVGAEEKATDIDPENYPGLDELIENMFETMYNADGVALPHPRWAEMIVFSWWTFTIG